ncbi:MAG: hypothetical protein KDA52_14170 [Planctomycetaceae bacterium]|nr:hypothetical protein [Planctomycetaceae bacterium]
MPSFKVAHVREQGVDLIIAPVNSSFHHMSAAEQTETIDAIEAAAHSAGLKGTVVPVWQVGDRMGFIAPQPWHPFFRSISWSDVLTNVNREVSW